MTIKDTTQIAVSEGGTLPPPASTFTIHGIALLVTETGGFNDTLMFWRDSFEQHNSIFMYHMCEQMVNQYDYIVGARGVAQKFKDEAAEAMILWIEAKGELARANAMMCYCPPGTNNKTIDKHTLVMPDRWWFGLFYRQYILACRYLTKAVNFRHTPEFIFRMRRLQTKLNDYVQTCKQQWQHDITAIRKGIEVEQKANEEKRANKAQAEMQLALANQLSLRPEVVVMDDAVQGIGAMQGEDTCYDADATYGQQF